MTQAITLYSGLTTSHPSISENLSSYYPILNRFLILPPEILSIILTKMGRYVIKSFVRLILTCKDFRIPLLSAVRYVEKLDICNNKLLGLFTGVKHLNTINSSNININLFSKNIWVNLESLIIPGNICYELYNSGYSESYLNQQPLECVKPNYFMPNLRTLEIYNTISDEDEKININKNAVPNIRFLVIANCQSLNLDEFGDLDEIELRYCSGITTEVLNNLRSRKLTLAGDCPMINWLNIDIPSLRSLVVEDMLIRFGMINNLKLEELFLYNTRLCVDSLEYLKMSYLSKLEIIGCQQIRGQPIREILNVGDESFPVLKYLRIERTHNINISASSLIDVRIMECSGITVSEVLYKYVKFWDVEDIEMMMLE